MISNNPAVIKGQNRNANSGISSNSNYTLAPETAESFTRQASSLKSDEDKYQAAVDLAKISLQNEEKVNDSMFKEAIDTYYDQMNPEKTGREMRGENGWTDLVGSTRDLINGFNTGIGNALDFGFDTAVGLPLELMGAKGAAQDARNLFTGEDLAIIPDIATDVALIASGVGIPLMVAKNAAQLSPQMAQGISGKDAITLEQMDAGQQAANAALGFGGLGLSLIPGIGKGVNVAKAASKDVAEEALNRTNQGGKNPYGKALSLVQATDSKVLADIDKRIQAISKENGLPPVQDMPDQMIKKILKG